MTNKIYFKGLNGLRIIAALLVFISHVEYVKKLLGYSNLFDLNAFAVAGAAGVNLFFCISGFLITYLLLIEKREFNAISLPDFYVRRILRIWPLYYFIMTVTLFVLPQFIHYPELNLDKPVTPTGVLLFVVFSPYIAKAIFSINFFAAVLWSIGVEETYYLFWPVIIGKLKNIKLSTFVITLLVFLGAKAVLTYLPYKVADPHLIFKNLSAIMAHLRLECMIIGGAFAWLLITGNPVIKYVQNTVVFIASLALLAFYFIQGFTVFYFHINPIVQYLFDPVICAVLYSVVIVNVISRKAVYTVMESKIPFELGQISYGFYVYHSICIVVSLMLLEKLGLAKQQTWLITVLAFVLNTTISYVSYHGFEKRFLKLKKKFTRIVTEREA